VLRRVAVMRLDIGEERAPGAPRRPRRGSSSVGRRRKRCAAPASRARRADRPRARGRRGGRGERQGLLRVQEGPRRGSARDRADLPRHERADFRRLRSRTGGRPSGGLRWSGCRRRRTPRDRPRGAARPGSRPGRRRPTEWREKSIHLRTPLALAMRTRSGRTPVIGSEAMRQGGLDRGIPAIQGQFTSLRSSDGRCEHAGPAALDPAGQLDEDEEPRKGMSTLPTRCGAGRATQPHFHDAAR
jgi:hypothetical protein